MPSSSRHSFSLCSVLLIVSSAASGDSFYGATNDENFTQYLQTALRAGDAALRSSSSTAAPTSNSGAAILYAPVVPALETSVAVAWKGLLAATGTNCRSLIAIGVGSDQPSFSERSRSSHWPNVAAKSNAALPCSSSRVLRAVVSSASRLQDLVPGFATLVIAVEPWTSDVSSSPVQVMRALSRPLCRGGVLLHLRLHEPVPMTGFSHATKDARIAAHAACSWDLTLPSPGMLTTHSTESLGRLPGISGSDSNDAVVAFEVVFAGQRATAVAAPGLTPGALPSSDGETAHSQASRAQQRLRTFMNPASSSASQLAAILEVAVESSGNALLLAHYTTSSSSSDRDGGGNDGSGYGRNSGDGIKWTRSAFQSPSLSVVAVDVSGDALSSDALIPGRDRGEELWCLGGDTPAALEWAKSAANTELRQLGIAASDLQAQGMDQWSAWLPKYYRTVNGALAGGDNAYSKSAADPLIPKTALRILDVGCGAGATSVVWRQLQAPNRKVTMHGLEADPLAALAAAGRLDRVWQGRVEDQIDKVPDHWYDTIVAADILEHLLQPDLTLAALRRKLNNRRPPSSNDKVLSQQPLPWPHPLLVVSVPNLAFWPESLSKLLDGTWNYEDHGVLDRTHLRWFTAQSFSTLAKKAGFDVVASFTIGSTEEQASQSFGEAYEALLSALPPHQRVDLNARQFVFWLRPTDDFFVKANEEDEDDEDRSKAPLAQRGRGDEEEEELAEKGQQEVVHEPSTPFSTKTRGGPVIAIAIVTSSAVSTERLPQLARTWAAPNLLEALLPHSIWPPPQGFESWMEVVAVSDRATTCRGLATRPRVWLKAATVAAATSQTVNNSDRIDESIDFYGGERSDHDGDDAKWCIPTVSCDECDGSKSGIPCRSWCAFRVVRAAFPDARWYLRLMDDTLVFPLNLVRALNALDFTQPVYAGDLALIQPHEGDSSSDDAPPDPIPFAFGGCGWALTAPALALLQAPESQNTWHAIESAARGSGPPSSHERGPGWSPATPNLRLDSAVADDVLFGLLVHSVNHANVVSSSSSSQPHIRAVAFPGWSQAPLDVLGGMPQCSSPDDDDDDDSRGNESKYAQEMVSNGLPAGFADVEHMCHRRVHDLGHWNHIRANAGEEDEQGGAFLRPPPSRALALGNCRPSGSSSEDQEGGEGVSPVVFHMGDEVGGESKVWRDQLGEQSSSKESPMGELLRAAHAGAASVESTKLRNGQAANGTTLVSGKLGLLASFEGSPLWYWRLCTTSHHDVASHDIFTLPGPTREAFISAARAPTRQQEVVINDIAATLEVGLCDKPLEVIQRLCHSIAGNTPELAVHRICDNSVVEALLRIAERLRDHARLHARPARVHIEIRFAEAYASSGPSNDDSPNKSTVHWVTAAVGDDPAAVGQSFAARHGFSDSDADRIATALENELLPFDYELMCSPDTS